MVAASPIPSMGGWQWYINVRVKTEGNFENAKLDLCSAIQQNLSFLSCKVRYITLSQEDQVR